MHTKRYRPSVNKQNDQKHFLKDTHHKRYSYNHDCHDPVNLSSNARSMRNQKSVFVRNNRQRISQKNMSTPLKGHNASKRLQLYIVGLILLVGLLAFSLFSFGFASQGEKHNEDLQDPSPEQVALSTADHSSMPTKTNEPFSIHIATTGDIIFGREVGTYIDMNGGASALAHVSDILATADITIANLEAPLTNNTSHPLPEKDVYLYGRPEGVESLIQSDITFISLANNHSMDYSGVGLKDTIEILDEAKILHAGAGMNEEEADKIAVTERSGKRVAFISWTDVIPKNFTAYKDSPGVASARLNMKAACNTVKKAKEDYDIVIIAMHWGIEYEDYTTPSLQNDPAYQLVDAGADVIIGNHPHVIQGIEFYKGSLISYSQGDFVFDHYSKKTGETFILEFDITHEGIQNVVATPVYLDDTYGIPRVVKGSDGQTILDRLRDISDGMNTRFDMHNDRAYITPLETD